MPQAALAIGSVLSVVGTVASVSAQRRADRARQRQQEVATRRSRRSAIRRAQLARAQALATAQGAGSIQSSGVYGGVQGVSSQLGADLGYSTQMSGLSQNIALQQRRMQMGQAIAGFGQSLSSFGLQRGASYSGLIEAVT